MKKITTLFVMLIALLSITTTFAQQDGSIDLTFNPVDEGGVNRIGGSIYEVKEQADGKVLVVGLLSEYLGQDIHNIIRLNADETLDTTFNPGTGANNLISDVLQLSDGKILICGRFTDYDGHACNGIARLNTNGSFDSTFNAVGLVANGGTGNLILAPDNKIVLIYGYVSGFNSYYKVARLNSDGSIDTTFNQGNGVMQPFTGIAVQNDGKILLAGSFSEYNGTDVNGLVRLNTDGTVDTGFIANLPGYDFFTAQLVLQSTGKIVVLRYLESTSVLSRYNPDGTEDATFIVPDDLQNAYVTSVSLYNEDKIFITYSGIFKRLTIDGSYDTTFTSPDTSLLSFGIRGVSQDGKIYIIGGFVSVNGVLDNGLARLNTDGSRDNTFNTGANAFTGADHDVAFVLKQDDNKLIISGSFQSYNGVSRTRIARLNEDGTLDLGFLPDNSLNGLYSAAGLYPGGKVLITGAGQLKRLNADGSIDASFNTQQFTDNAGFDRGISALLVLPDGKIVVAGSFNLYGATSAPHICRLNADGSLDTTFSCSVLEDAAQEVGIQLIDLPSEQKFLIGATGASSILYKINYNGTEDTTFNHVPSSLIFWVDSFTVEYDGKILVAGYGDGGIYYNQKLIRFNANGTVNQILIDRDFDVYAFVSKIVATPDGKYYVSGLTNFFQPLTGVTIARFNNDGSLDNTFTSGETIGTVYDFAFQGNSIVVGGSFHDYNGVAKNNILRLHTSGVLATEALQANVENVLVYRDKENINISALHDVLQNVQVYDLQGRLVVNQDSIYKSDAALPVHARLNILIVKATLTDGTVVTRKIY